MRARLGSPVEEAAAAMFCFFKSRRNSFLKNLPNNYQALQDVEEEADDG